jgi:RNA polymerase sigma factor (sigma-70 family)
MIEDHVLLQCYADKKSEEAFAEVVRRHVDFVYSIALRQVGGDAHLAQDVSQAVFTALARKAGALAARPVLGGWLYRTTQFTAIDAVRGEQRRRAREQEAQLMHELTRSDETAADAEKLRPLLDRAIGELGDDDHDAVVLRFFNGFTFPEIAARLRLTESGARMRVERALDKLHAGLARRGVTSTGAALALALANQPAVAAPAGLAAAITGAALAGAGAASVAGVKILTFMSTTKILGGLAGMIVIAAVGTAIYEADAANRKRAALEQATQQQSELQAKLRNLEARLTAETKRAQAAEEDNAKLLGAIAQAKTSSEVAQAAAAAAPITDAVVQSRYQHAQELVRKGNWEPALTELLWCFDEGMVRIPAFGGVRRSFLLSDLGKLAQNYPPALAALQARRDKAQQRMEEFSTDSQAPRDFAAINNAIGETTATLKYYDELPATDPRRRGLAAIGLYDLFVDRQRYADALQARPYESMNSLFDRIAEQARQPPAPGLSSEAAASMRRGAIGLAAQNVETLAGAGDLAHARELAEKLLAFDNSAGTLQTLQQHLSRAGHPELLNTVTKP